MYRAGTWTWAIKLILAIEEGLRQVACSSQSSNYCLMWDEQIDDGQLWGTIDKCPVTKFNHGGGKKKQEHLNCSWSTVQKGPMRLGSNAWF